MPMQVCMGAMMQCSFGMAPSSLVVLPKNETSRIRDDGAGAVTIGFLRAVP